MSVFLLIASHSFNRDDVYYEASIFVCKNFKCLCDSLKIIFKDIVTDETKPLQDTSDIQYGKTGLC